MKGQLFKTRCRSLLQLWGQFKLIRRSGKYSFNGSSSVIFASGRDRRVFCRDLPQPLPFKNSRTILLPGVAPFRQIFPRVHRHSGSKQLLGDHAAR